MGLPSIPCSISGVAALLGVTLTALPAAALSSAITWEERIAVAAGDAFQGPWRMNDSQFLYVDDPTVAITDTGIVGIAWADNARQDIFFQAYQPGGFKQFEEPVNVSGSPDTFSWLPRMTIRPDNENVISIIWQEIVFSGGSHGGEIFFSHSKDGGLTFSKPINLSLTPTGAGKGRLDRRRWHNGSLDLAKGFDGMLYAVWSEYEGGLWLSRSIDGGESFSEPLHVTGDDHQPARGPAVTVGDSGALYLAWTVGEDPNADIRFSRSDDQGHSFTAPLVMRAGDDGHADAPKLAVDSKGVVHLVYGESPGGPGGRYHIRYTRLDSVGRSFTEPRAISVPQSEEFWSVNFPSLAIDDNDNPYVLWEIFQDQGERPLGLGFTYSNDGGENFTSPAVIPGSLDPDLGVNGSLQGLLMKKLAVNETGNIAVVNSTFKQDELSTIWLFLGQAVR